MHVNRRQFLEASAGSLLLAACPRILAAGAPTAKAPFRVLYNNDTTNITSCVSPYHKAREAFTSEMLEASVDEVAGLVDAHFLQPGLGEVPMWPSKVYPLEEHYRWIKETYGLAPDTFGKYALAGGDAVKVFIDRCRLRGQAPFVSVRLNDAHSKEFVDAKPGDKIGGGATMALTPFYRDHPEYRVGSNLRSAAQHALNWAIPEVVARKFALLGELCENYDLDGLELDFMRFYNFFRTGETTKEQRCGIMTEFVRKVRALLDRTARGGRRRWLCARVPGFVSALDPLGLDLPALENAGLDMVNLSASYFTTQRMEVAAIRRMAPGAALYVEMCHSVWNGAKLTAGYDVFPFRRTTPEEYETTAHLAYVRGADGVSVFNFAYYREHGGAGRGPFNEPPFETLKHLGDRNWVAARPQHWFLAPGWENPFAKPAILPRKLAPGQPLTLALDLAAPAGGWTKDGRLRVQTLQPVDAQRLVVKMNGALLAPTDDRSEPFLNPYPPMLGTRETLAAWTAPGALLREGVNDVEVGLAAGDPADVAFLDLAVD